MALPASQRGALVWPSLTDASNAATGVAQGLLEECGSALYRDLTERERQNELLSIARVCEVGRE